MVADYLTHGLGSVPPVRFAEWYYVHYPKVAIGHWPFGFHVLLGAWMAVAGVSRGAALLFQGACVALSSCLLFFVLRKVTSDAAALVAALAFPLLQMVQLLSSAVMTEVLGGLFLWFALVSFSYWIESSQPRWAYAFAVAASAAIMTRPNGWLLALVPPIAAAILRKARLLYSPPMMIAAAAVAITCIPFYAANLGAMKDGTLLPNTATFIRMAVHSHLIIAALFILIGPILSLAAFYGFWLKCGQPLFRKQQSESFWAVMLSAVAAILIFTLAVPSALDYNRFLYPALFPALAFAAAGLEDLLSRPWASHRVWCKPFAISSLMLVTGCFSLARAQRPIHSIFGIAAKQFLADSALNNPVVLISSAGESGEGRFIAELVAQQGKCCRYFVERATQQLATSNFDATRYSVRYQTDDSLRRRLEEGRVALIVVHSVAGRKPLPHQVLLEHFLESSRSDWRAVARIESPPAGKLREEVIFYKNRRLFGETPHLIQVDLRGKIGRRLKVAP